MVGECTIKNQAQPPQDQMSSYFTALGLVAFTSTGLADLNFWPLAIACCERALAAIVRLHPLRSQLLHITPIFAR